VSACPHRDDAGAWVLGALAEDDARAFAAHLTACAACRRDVGELQGVADVLPMAAPQVVPPPELKERIMGAVRAETDLAAPAPEHAPAREPRRRWWARVRPLPALALAAVVLAIGIATGVLLAGGDETQTFRGTGPRGAQVALRVQDGKGELVLRGMPPPPPGRVYQVWLQRGNASPQPTHALFTVPRDGRATVSIGEPPGGSRAPTTKPVAGATLT
jgi:hypothetical protein